MADDVCDDDKSDKSMGGDCDEWWWWWWLLSSFPVAPLLRELVTVIVRLRSVWLLHWLVVKDPNESKDDESGLLTSSGGFAVIVIFIEVFDTGFSSCVVLSLLTLFAFLGIAFREDVVLFEEEVVLK